MNSSSASPVLPVKDPRVGSQAYALLIAVTAAVGGLLFGYDTSVISGAILFVRSLFQLSSTQTELAVSIVLAGAALGAAVAGYFADWFSRKPVLIDLFGVSNVPRNAILFDVIAYLASFAVGLGPIFWLLISEIYPTTVRGEAMSLSSVVIWLSDLLVTMTFLSLVEGLGPRASFWLYAGACLVALVFSARMVPETKGRTLEEIETSWTT
jgi:MFS family permease